MLKKLKLWDETIEPAIRIGAKVDLDAMRQRAIRDIEKKGGFVMKKPVIGRRLPRKPSGD
jgi:hypothetical protein